MRIFVTLTIALITAPALIADTRATEAAGTESLGDQLLDDLAPEMRQPPAAVPPKPRANILAPNDHFAPDPENRAHPRFDDLGEDIGQPSGPLSLARVRQEMQRAETLLADPRGVSDARLVQKQVVAQLDKLIEELSKQCQACQQGGQSPQPNAGQRSQPKPGKPTSAMARGNTAARDSTDRLDQASAQPVDKGDMDELVKNLWGHLPERSREQMMQSFSDEFLPKYELEIEEYYRRLSEEKYAAPAAE